MKITSRGRRRILAGIASAAIATLALTGCASGSSSGGDGASGGTTDITFQLSWYKLSQFNGLFAADKEGYYSDEKIKATFVPGGADILAWQQITGGKALLGDEDNTLLLQAIADGEDLQVIGTIFQASPFAIMSNADDPITDIQDFKGKTIAVPDNGIAQFQSLVAAAGIPADDVTFVPAGSDPTQLVTGQVDGYTGYATSQGASLELQGLDINYLYLTDLGIPSYANMIVTTKKNIKDHRDEIENFMTAAVKGYEYLGDHGDEMADYLVNTVNPTGGLDVDSEKLSNKIQKSLMTNDKGYLTVDIDRMQAVIDALYDAGTLTKKLDAKDVVDTSILEDVYGGKTTLSN
jgi:NitT/TauT family transport system substrate-binding protein